MSQFTPQEKADAARRERDRRYRVYPILVEQGRMTQQVADRQIALMCEIVADYEALTQAEQPSLFGETP